MVNVINRSGGQWLVVLLLLMGLLKPLTSVGQDADGWQSLFNGKTLDGWMQKGGSAEYYVEDAMIVGEAVLNTPNSFLCTKKTYRNFILEFEVKVDGPLNSGVQFRSKSTADYRDYRVHGYQVEIDPVDPIQSGGIYDEARRGWLYNRAKLENPKPAFELDSWNHYRIEAIGDTLRTWVNGIPTAHVIDSVTDEGFIGLQVHSIGDSSKVGTTVRWRELRIMTGPDARAQTRSMELKPKVYK